MKPIQVFFNNIACRMNHENDLSDFTWAMCQSSATFMSEFVHLFFDGLDVNQINSFQREVPDDQNKGSRVDLLFTLSHDNTPYLIEVKIGDQNQHFGQYEEAYNIPKERLGYITNYPLKYEDYKIKQWKDFYSKLKESINSFPENEIDLCEGYLSYLQSVCHLNNFTKPMNIKAIYYMYEFLSIIEELLSIENENYSLSIYGRNRSTLGVEYRWFEIKYKKITIEKQVWGAFGIWYDKENPEIGIGFENSEGWGKNIFEIIKRNEKIETTFCSAPYIEDNTYYFSPNPKILSDFDKCSLDEQKEILKKFIDEVVMYPVKVLSSSN